MRKKPGKYVRLDMKILATYKEMLKGAADAEGLTLTDYVLQACREKMERQVTDGLLRCGSEQDIQFVLEPFSAEQLAQMRHDLELDIIRAKRSLELLDKRGL